MPVGAESIKRLESGHRDTLDFEGLFKEGLRIAQEVSGETWTDYNQHDPGVTILEALCYVLTDLVYRTDFHVSDYLTASDGNIDFGRQAMYRPEEVFPTHPVTGNDYCKLILTSVPYVDNVWVRPDESSSPDHQGLYRIFVQLSERVSDQGEAVVIKAFGDVVRKLYSANRNLCEDLADVEIVRRIPYSLRGEIEIGGKRDPADILAGIYFECSQYLTPRVPVHSHAEKYKQGHSLEMLFNGVFNENGYVEDDDLHPWRGHFSISDLIAGIARIDGVKNINRLVFVDSFGNESDTINLESSLSHRAVACLDFSLPIEDVSLLKAGKAFPVSRQDVKQEYTRLNYKFEISRQHKYSIEWLEDLLPRGTYRNVGEYYSMQNHFPDIYGLNAYGVAETASPGRKAQAAQLKAYLLFFEQIMANFLQNLHEIPRLFSLDEQLRQSYFHQTLGNDEVPGAEALYLDGVSGMDKRLAGLLRTFDHYDERRNRILDYLLGMYGEKFSQNSLRHFFSDGTQDHRIGNKIAFVKDMVNLGKNRSSAFDYCDGTALGGNLSGLEGKLRLLLGQSRGGGDVQEDGGEESIRTAWFLVEHILLRPVGGLRYQGLEVPEGFYRFRLSLVFPASESVSANTAFRQLAEETVVRNCPAHVYPEVFWLEPDRMNRFTDLHESWLKVKRSLTSTEKAVNDAARELLRFMLEIKEMHA